MLRQVRHIRGRFLATFLAAATGAVTGAIAQQPPAAGRSTPIVTLVERLRNDAEFRSRFADAPKDVMRIFGVDPTPYELPDKLDAAQLERLLNDLMRIAPPRAGVAPPIPSESSRGVAVYGPPPGERKERK